MAWVMQNQLLRSMNKLELLRGEKKKRKRDMSGYYPCIFENAIRIFEGLAILTLLLTGLPLFGCRTKDAKDAALVLSQDELCCHEPNATMHIIPEKRNVWKQ